jgi:hypothetical protein
MGLGSHTQISDRAFAPDIPETGLCSGSGLFLSSGSTTTQAGPRWSVMAYLLDTAVAEACTGRAAGGTGNPTRLASIPLGGVA